MDQKIAFFAKCCLVQMISTSFCEDSVYDGFYVIYFSLCAPAMAYLVSKNNNLMQHNELQKTSKLELTCNAVFTKKKNFRLKQITRMHSTLSCTSSSLYKCLRSMEIYPFLAKRCNQRPVLSEDQVACKLLRTADDFKIFPCKFNILRGFVL